MILRSTVVPLVEPAPGLGEEGAGDLRSTPQALSLHEVEGDLDLAGRLVFLAAPLQGLLLEPQIGVDLPGLHSLLERQGGPGTPGLRPGLCARSWGWAPSQGLNKRAVWVGDEC